MTEKHTPSASTPPLPRWPAGWPAPISHLQLSLPAYALTPDGLAVPRAWLQAALALGLADAERSSELLPHERGGAELQVAHLCAPPATANPDLPGDLQDCVLARDVHRRLGEGPVGDALHHFVQGTLAPLWTGPLVRAGAEEDLASELAARLWRGDGVEDLLDYGIGDGPARQQVASTLLRLMASGTCVLRG